MQRRECLYDTPMGLNRVSFGRSFFFFSFPSFLSTDDNDLILTGKPLFFWDKLHLQLLTLQLFLSYHGYEFEAFRPKHPAIPAGCEILTSLLAFGWK